MCWILPVPSCTSTSLSSCPNSSSTSTNRKLSQHPIIMTNIWRLVFFQQCHNQPNHSVGFSLCPCAPQRVQVLAGPVSQHPPTARYCSIQSPVLSAFLHHYQWQLTSWPCVIICLRLHKKNVISNAQYSHFAYHSSYFPSCILGHTQMHPKPLLFLLDFHLNRIQLS